MHGSAGKGKTPLADGDLGVISQQVRAEAKVKEKMPREDPQIDKRRAKPDS